jgi:hypothetical protein
MIKLILTVEVLLMRTANPDWQRGDLLGLDCVVPNYVYSFI